MKRKIIKLILLIGWMILIFSFSMDNATESSNKSNSIIIWITENIFNKNYNEEDIDIITNKYSFIVRKTAHFTIYFILGLFFIMYLEEYHSLSKKDIIYTILFVLIYACSDELHQLFTIGRSGEIRDVLLDTLGGVLSSICYYSIYKKTNKDI